MKHGSLFSGIGGFDLAAEWMGWENIFHCEWNEFGKRVLNYYWPNAISYDDITKTDFTIHRGAIDILTGGFPCQPYSVAGKRKGKEDERHLWPEMLRTIREIQPRYVVGENVAGIISWDGGLVFHEVQVDLENEGYEVWAFILPAAGVNAPHKRERVWFIAKNTKCNGFIQRKFKQEGTEIREQRNACTGSCNGICISKRVTTNTNSTGWEKLNIASKSSKQNINYRFINNPNSTSEQGEYIGQKGERKFNRPNCRNGFNNFENFPTQPPICSGDDGISERLDGITFPKWRAESIKAYGNAIVPQVVYQIFKAIEILDNNYL